MAIPDNIMERLRRLKDVTIEKGYTPSEAGFAAARLAEMLEEHQLSMLDIQTGELKEEAEMMEHKHGYRRPPPWQVQYATEIAVAFDCVLIFSKLSYKFVGLASDVTVAEFYYSQTWKSVRDAGRAEGDRWGYAGHHLTAFTSDFVMAAGVAVRRRLAADRKSRAEAAKSSGGSGSQAGGAALVLVDKKKEAVDSYIEKHFPKVREDRGAYEPKNQAGTVAGWQYGNQMDIHAGLAGAESGRKQIV